MIVGERIAGHNGDNLSVGGARGGELLVSEDVDKGVLKNGLAPLLRGGENLGGLRGSLVHEIVILVAERFVGGGRHLLFGVQADLLRQVLQF